MLSIGLYECNVFFSSDIVTYAPSRQLSVDHMPHTARNAMPSPGWQSGKYTAVCADLAQIPRSDGSLHPNNK